MKNAKENNTMYIQFFNRVGATDSFFTSVFSNLFLCGIELFHMVRENAEAFKW